MSALPAGSSIRMPVESGFRSPQSHRGIGGLRAELPYGGGTRGPARGAGRLYELRKKAIGSNQYTDKRSGQFDHSKTCEKIDALELTGAVMAYRHAGENLPQSAV